MKILGIETSCDETAAAVVENGTQVLASIVASSAEMHAASGGIIPEQAARQQIKSIIPVIQEALTASHQSPTSIDAIAVTGGPGLIGSLLVGIETAKTLAHVWQKPLVPVNHLVGHIYANWIGGTPDFPALALVVSGGHTDLVLMKNHGNLKWIGGTRDDAAGEAFDKCARLLGLPYPGGPSISAEAEKYHKSKIINHKSLNLFPRPLSNEDNFDWSFSGLKTAVLREVRNHKENLSPQDKSELAAEIQEAIVDSLVIKSIRAIEKLHSEDGYSPKSFLLAGGVAANSRLREKFKNRLAQLSPKHLGVSFHVPVPIYCTDNATYIATAAYYNYKPIKWEKVSANPELTIVS